MDPSLSGEHQKEQLKSDLEGALAKLEQTLRGRFSFELIIRLFVVDMIKFSYAKS